MLAPAAVGHKSIMVELVIHEFDQWANPADATIAPTSICWYQPDPEAGPGR